ncbi:MAG: carbon monoxide dehydrogenase [Streptosporangiales bacterium]|nr:carbon monoxide dehydrogenase [Streptosporangiales bacterium]
MKVTGSAVVRAPVRKVWDALANPAVLAKAIPGCDSVETAGPDAYRMTVSMDVAQVSGTYAGTARVTDRDPPRSFVLRVSGQGAPGTADATVAVRLSEAEGEATQVEYDADAVAGGALGGVGQRVLAGVAKRAAAEFFVAVDGELTGTAAGPVTEAGARIVAGADRRVPVPAAPARGRWAIAAALAAGGAAALLGVALGWLLAARRSRTRSRPPRSMLWGTGTDKADPQYRSRR